MSIPEMIKLSVCGIDEAGRGPLAGPVYAAAVILDPKKRIRGLKDSKLLSPEKRDTLLPIIKSKALAWSIAFATVEEIDRINILQASLLAMERAVAGLPIVPDEAWVDGNRPPKLGVPIRMIVGGDRLHPCISAASILAKTARDAEMVRLHTIKLHGVCEIYRQSFLPVRLARK
jgi:ribonuclease HII